MSPVTLSTLFAISVVGISLVTAQSTTSILPTTSVVPLASKSFPSPSQLPYKVDTDTGLIRGVQKGYNICNSTTENQNSLCQTAYFNAYNDFCLWAPPEPNKTVGDIEGEMVAWCSKPGHGTRLIPAEALQGLEFRKTPDFIQVAGFIDQTKINMNHDDTGGEMDPHGADLRGNPMGGVMYSNVWKGSDSQVIEWTNFMGSDTFCLKACNPDGPNAARFCEHIYDRIGCAYNAPSNAKRNTFEACEADSGDFPGVYTVSGTVTTYSQPAESLGAITSIPYTARVPPASRCTTYTSSVIFTGLPTVSGSRPTSTGASSVKKSSTLSASIPSSTSTSSNSTSDGTVLVISGASFLGVIFSALFLA